MLLYIYITVYVNRYMCIQMLIDNYTIVLLIIYLPYIKLLYFKSD